MPRPLSLVGNWIAECRKFFRTKDLRAKVLTAKEWDDDLRPNTIWIWPATTFQSDPLVERIMAPDVCVLALCGDESHAYFKSVKSQRSRSAATVIAKAEMVTR
jgi:hypothetical protein